MGSDQLDGVITTLLIAGAVTVPVVSILTSFMSRYARNHNSHYRGEFLKKELGVEDLNQVNVIGCDYDPSGNRLTQVSYAGENYVLTSAHAKTTWFADLFEDTRLYKPVSMRVADS